VEPLPCHTILPESSQKARTAAAAVRFLTAISIRYWCGELSTWLLQYFFMSLFDSLGLLAFCESMQSFICCFCDLLVVVVLDDCVVVVELLVLG
jgi:hypothetical protein